MNALPAWMGAYLAAFTHGLDDDLNISEALAVIFDFITDVNKEKISGKQ